MHMTTTTGSRPHATPRPTRAAAVLRSAMRDRRSPAVERYASRLLGTDLLLVAAATLTSYFLVFGTAGQVLVVGSWQVPYLWVALAVSLVWLLSLDVVGSRDHRIVGNGTTEYRRVASSGVVVLGVIAVFTLGAQVEFSRGFTFANLPLTLLTVLAGRVGARHWLAAQRRLGRYCSTVLVVGSAPAVEAVTRDLQANPTAGLRIVGACLPAGQQSAELTAVGIPIRSGVDDVPRMLSELGADTVLVTSSPELTPRKLRELTWSLESGRYNLMLTPSLTDIAGPRMHARAVAGLPLIHVDIPEFAGLGQVGKRMFDIVGSVTLILLTAPLWMAIAISIRLSGPGPIFYSQERIGQNGVPFRMLKFRTMVPDADRRLTALLEERGLGSTPLFKLDDDPRVTSIGRVMRRYSIDEFPQLLNVLRGEMSLVGPRPQIAAEVALYDHAAQRRLIVKPGMTGLWQVSGRSSLTWEEAVRLDLYYLENWSTAVDLIILFRTVRAVIRPGIDAR